MISTHDLLYLVAAFCLLVITGTFVVVAVRLLSVLADIERIARNVEEMTGQLDRITSIVFPALERVAKRADSLEQSLANFIKKHVEKLIP